MLQRLLQSITIVLLLTTTSMAQVQREPGPSLQERALRVESYILASANRYGIAARLLRIVCALESRFRLTAISPKGARGLMQFMPETARRYGLHDPYNPKAAIDAGAHYLRDLLVRFGGRLDLALASYNAGEGVVESFQTGRPLLLTDGKIINPRGLVTGGVPPYRETQEYVKSAMLLIKGRTKRFALLQVKPALPSNSRDFSLDVMNEDEFSPVRISEKASSLFIEIQ